VENAPFLVTKLKIQVLPCVISFVDGISVDRIIGFEGLGRTPDAFTTKDLEARLLRANVLTRPKIIEEGSTSASHRHTRDTKNSEDDEDDEWD
jgi:hypothetical protein